MNQLPQANKDIWKINIAIYNGHLVSAYTLESLNLIHVRFARYHRAGLNTPDNKKTIYWACFGSFIRTNFGFFSAIVQNSVLPRLRLASNNGSGHLHQGAATIPNRFFQSRNPDPKFRAIPLSRGLSLASHLPRILSIPNLAPISL